MAALDVGRMVAEAVAQALRQTADQVDPTPAKRGQQLPTLPGHAWLELVVPVPDGLLDADAVARVMEAAGDAARQALAGRLQLVERVVQRGEGWGAE